MKIVCKFPTTIIALFLSLTALAQQSPARAPSKEEIRIKGWETLHFWPSAPVNGAVEKPTAIRQRLVGTEAEVGHPQNNMVVTNKMVNNYSGYHGSRTGTHGLEPFSAYDSSYSLMNGSYINQRFFPSGKLQYLYAYSDKSPGSGPGAHKKTTCEYDAQNRLLLDSFSQAGQPGSNLDWKYRYAYDDWDRLVYVDFEFNSQDPGGYSYRIASWKLFNGGNQPFQDSVLIIEDGLSTIKIVKHYYNNANQLIADSAYRVGVFATAPMEVTRYEYLAGGKRVSVLSQWVGNVWSPYERIEQTLDHFGKGNPSSI